MQCIAIRSNVFVPYQCNVCLLLEVSHEINGDSMEAFKPKTQLSPCTDCGLVFYCSKKHRDLDSGSHSQLCTALQAIKLLYSVDHPYLLCGPPKDAFSFERATYQVKHILRKTLKRPLNSFEEDQTSFPAHCAVCYSVKKTIPCQHCWAVGYCCDEHAKQHFPKHIRRCGLLQAYHTRFKATMIPNPETIIKKLYNPVTNLLDIDLIDAFQHVAQKQLPIYPTQSLESYELFALAASFSCMSTICFALSHCNMTKYNRYEKKKFVIYIVGATEEHQLSFSEMYTKFFFLQFPSITILDIYFFGPEVSTTKPRTISYKLQGIKRYVTYRCFSGTIEVFKESNSIEPSLIVGFNCGFTNVSPKETFVSLTDTGEESKDDGPVRREWTGTLSDIIQTYYTPILFTSYSSLEAEFDFQAISEAAKTDFLKAKLEHIFDVIENPFRDFRPLRNWQEIHGPDIYYRNGYVQAVISTLKDPGLSEVN